MTKVAAAPKGPAKSATPSNRAEPRVFKSFNASKGEVSVVSKSIRTLEDALREAEVDLAVWEVDRYTVNKWDGLRPEDLGVAELWQVKIHLRKKMVAQISETSFREDWIKRMDLYSPKFPKYPELPKKRRDNSGVLYEISTFDPHFAKLCWDKETRHGNYDLDIACRMVKTALRDLVSRADSMKVDRYLLPIGNDLFHVEMLNQTTAGTPQDTDGRWQRAFLLVRELMCDFVEELSAKAPVDVVMVYGNHDRHKTWYLGDTMQSWFRKCSRVRIDNRPTLRKYVGFGDNLIGFTHGDGGKQDEYPLLMAQEVPDLWGRTKYREMHIGHFHVKRKTVYRATDTFKSVVVRVIPSLCPPDAWHSNSGYAPALRGAEAFAYHRTKGLIAEFYHQPQDEEIKTAATDKTIEVCELR